MNSIESVSVDLSVQRLREEAAIQVQAMSQKEAEAQAAAMVRALESAEVITDPYRGNLVDLLA